MLYTCCGRNAAADEPASKPYVPAPATVCVGPEPLLPSHSRCSTPASPALTFSVGVLTLVMSSLLLTPLSLALCRSGAAGAVGATVSIVTDSEALSEDLLPARSSTQPVNT